MPSYNSRRNKKSVRDLNGTWIISKSLSSGIPPALAIQGFDAAERRAIIASPIRLYISQSNYPSQIFVKHSSLAQTERLYPPQRKSEWSKWSGDDTLSRCRWVVGTEMGDEGACLIEGGLLGEFLEVEVECESGGWWKREVWLVDGVGRLVRRGIFVASDGRKAETRQVYELEE